MSHVTRYKLHDARECVLPPGNLWKPPASSTPFGSSPAQGDTPYLPVQPASWLRRLPSPSGIAARGIPPHPMEASGFLDPLRVEPPRRGYPLPPRTARKRAASRLCRVLALARRCMPRRAALHGRRRWPPLHPLARLLPRQSAARKRSDTCRETRGLVRSVSRYVTSSPSHSGRHEELHPLFYALSLCK